MAPQKKPKRPFRQRFASTLQLVCKQRQSQPLPDKPPESIAILAKERYGDCIMLTPLIGELRRTYPNLAIYIIAFNRIIFEFFSADPNVTAVYHAKRNINRYYRGILSKKFDLLFNPKDHPSTHFLIQSKLIRARYKVSHSNPFHEGLFDYLIDTDHLSHESRKNLSLLTLIDAARQPQHCRPYLPPMPVSDDAQSFLSTLEEGKYIGINISAGHSGGHRTPSQWSELVSNFPLETFVIFSSPQDLAEKRAIEQRHCNIRQSPATGNLYEVGEIVKKLRVLITPDTSLIHVASCSLTPLIGLYRASLADRAQFGPLSPIQEVIVSPTPDVVDITTDTIVTSLKRVLAMVPAPGETTLSSTH
ncbi:MAG: glycosyltransferase family 9 protein [Chlorobiaceae bacterium]